MTNGNAGDAYLYGLGNGVGNSPVYFKGGKSLPYYADFRVNFVSVNPTKTRVQVATFNSHVMAGTEWHPMAKAGIFVNVEPTSIEEYQILFDIGKNLSISNMPPLKIPGQNSPTRRIKVSRMR
jgi:hypothetical protein